MKSKLSFLFVLTLISMAVAAQTYRAEIGYINPRQQGEGFSASNFNGIRLGATAQFDLKYNFSLVTGTLYQVLYSQKIQKYSVSSDSVSYKTWGHYLDIPVHLQYSLPLGKKFKLFAFAGPTFNVGLAQPQKITSFLTNEMADFTGIQSKSYSENDLYLNSKIHRLNFQLSTGGGLQWTDYQIKGGYDFGINNLNKQADNRHLHQGGWFVSLSYQF